MRRHVLPVLVLFGCAGSALPASVPLGSGHARLAREGDVLHVNMEVENGGIGSLMIQSGDRLWILHASAALGTGIYTRDGDHWRRTQDFTFECRDNADTACRSGFRDRAGWIANVEPRGGADRRFEVDVPRFGTSPRIAIAYLLFEPQAVVRWPADVDDDAVSLAVQQGMLPETIRVRPERWAEVAR
jgi:hypothetical protein